MAQPMTSSARRRHNRKFGPKRTPEQLLLARDQERASAERRLLGFTLETPKKCGLQQDRIQVFWRLFRKKENHELSKDEATLKDDDMERRMAVRDIMQAREVAGFEADGETERWEVGPRYEPRIDIQKELNAKFNTTVFKEQTCRLRERKWQRRFLEWNLEQPDKGAIPRSKIVWLRGVLNHLVRPPKDDAAAKRSQLSRMQGIYYIFACRVKAGIPFPIDMTIEDPGDERAEELLEVHEFLISQPPEFFTRPDFDADIPYDIELGLGALLKDKGVKKVDMKRLEQGVEVNYDGENEKGNDDEAKGMSAEAKGTNDDGGPIPPEPVLMSEWMAPEPVSDMEM